VNGRSWYAPDRAPASADVEEVEVVGQVWWWVLLAVVVVAALLAVLLLRRRGHAEVLSEQTGIAAAAAGGVGGAVGAAGVAAAASQAGHDEVRIDEREMPSPQDDAGKPASVDAEAEQRPSAPDPVDSALAALDSGRVESHTEPGASAAAAVAAALTRPGPHEGSVLPAADGSTPADEYTIKANEGSGKYYTHDSPYYVRTRADLWFRSTADAEHAGFALWDSDRRTGRET
jgi:hypothetical protein